MSKTILELILVELFYKKKELFAKQNFPAFFVFTFKRTTKHTQGNL